MIARADDREPALPVHASGTFAIGGELDVHRLGFGAMRLPGVRGTPRPGEAREILREAVRLGIDLIDSAHAYGRSEELIADALHPYPPELVIATKGGLGHNGEPDGRPERLREDCELSLRRLRLDTIDLWQLHRIDPAIPLEEQFGAMGDLRAEGKIRFLGVSEVSVEELRRARGLVEIATVQNRYNVDERGSDGVLAECEAHALGFLPWAPIGMGGLAGSAQPPARPHGEDSGATKAQRALSWLLQRSGVILPIPGTGSIEHLRENVGAADPIHRSLSMTD